ncbi:MAG: OmpA family protein [Planctomycetota bacterium]
MTTNTGLFGALLLLTFGFTSCASPKVLKEYKDEIRDLREERVSLKKRNRDLQLQLDEAEIRIANASASVPAEVFDIPVATGFDFTGVDVRSTSGGDLVVSISNEVTFSSGKATLTQNGKNTLRSVARELVADHGGREYWIEGHTDTDPIRKSSWANNRELSYARASAVHAFLVEECGVPDDQCRVVAAGQYDPVADNNSATGKSANRRVQIVVRRPRD